ncbi:MAG: hypothetical protein O7H39_06860, partial [Gammaproteobacteria bacterium]|nr:hypothetical protein [Gammaproteobacteria bacterium]
MLVLKNGDRITGKIKRLWDEEISIDPKYSDTFDVDLDAVAYIDSERDFEIEIDGKHMQIARFSGADEHGNQILVIGGEQVVLPLQDIAELEEIEDYFDWEANADLNANGSSGNTENLNTRLNLDGLLKVGRNRHVADAVFARETQGPILTKDQSTINYSYQRLFKGSPWFFGLNGG